jgi:LEA14-like dessication related protein
MLAVLIPVLLQFGCAGLNTRVEEPSVTLISVEPAGDQSSQRFAVTLRIHNPNEVELPIKSLSFALEISDLDFAHGVTDQALTVPARGNALLDLEVASTLDDSVDRLRAFGSRKDGVSYKLWGRVSLSKYASSMPFDQEGRLVFGSGASATARP